MSIRATANDSGFAPFTAVTGSLLLHPRIGVDRQPPPDGASESVRELANRLAETDFLSGSDGRHHSLSQPYMPADLSTCTHVWLRVDRVRRAMEAPYVGPLRVCTRSDRWFQVELPSGRTDTVSVERLKPAYFPHQPVDPGRADAAPPGVAPPARAASPARTASPSRAASPAPPASAAPPADASRPLDTRASPGPGSAAPAISVRTDSGLSPPLPPRRSRRLAHLPRRRLTQRRRIPCRRSQCRRNRCRRIPCRRIPHRRTLCRRTPRRRAQCCL